MGEQPAPSSTLGRLPPPFDYAPGQDKYLAWQNYLATLDDFLDLNAHLYDSEVKKAKALWSIAGPKVQALRVGLKNKIPEDAANIYKNTAKTLTDYFAPSKNVIAARHIFQSCRQGSMTFNEYEAELDRLAAECNFDANVTVTEGTDSIRDQRVRDQLIFGMSNDNIRRKLLEQTDLTRALAFTKAKAAEASMLDQSQISSGQSTSKAGLSDVTLVLKKSQSSGKFCKYCRKSGHVIQDCYAKQAADQRSQSAPGTQFRGRGQRGISRGRGQFRNRGRGRGQFQNQNFSAMWPMYQARRNFGHTVNANFSGKPVSFVVDTGADVSVFSSDLVKGLGLSDTILPEEVPTNVITGDGVVTGKCQRRLEFTR